MSNNLLDNFIQKYCGLEIIIFVGSFSFCIFPKIIKKVDKLARIFPILTLVSAGFLLGVLLLDFIPHMFPHSHKHHHDEDDIYHRSIAVGMISAGVALLSLITIDQCVIKHDHCEEATEDVGEKHECGDKEEKNDSHHQCTDLDLSENNIIKHSHVKGVENCHEEEKYPERENIKRQDFGCCNTKMLQNTQSKTRALIYIFSISIHSLFEGLGMRPSGFGAYEFGILIHKILESFAIGTTLFNSAFSFNVCVLMNIFYSFLTPLGIYLGKIFSSDLFTIFNISISFYFNGLALGSLMFIVFLEMIPGAFHKKGNKSCKMSGLIGGFLFSAFIIIMTHSHQEHHSH
ncbi:hypothetical protein P3W45_000537 [Vairimorpha bombi]|jgi:solute carrier family 39 (zinc transporter), member 1/2/3